MGQAFREAAGQTGRPGRVGSLAGRSGLSGAAAEGETGPRAQLFARPRAAVRRVLPERSSEGRSTRGRFDRQERSRAAATGLEGGSGPRRDRAASTGPRRAIPDSRPSRRRPPIPPPSPAGPRGGSWSRAPCRRAGARPCRPQGSPDEGRAPRRGRPRTPSGDPRSSCRDGRGLRPRPPPPPPVPRWNGRRTRGRPGPSPACCCGPGSCAPRPIPGPPGPGRPGRPRTRRRART